MKPAAFLLYLQTAFAAVLSTHDEISNPIVSRLDTASSPRDDRLTTVYEYPNNTWVENIAVRKDGKLLVTLISSPEVHLVDPISKTQSLVHRFPNATAGMGIAELDENLFAVAIGNWSAATFKASPGSWSVWTVDFRQRGRGGKSIAAAKVKKVTDIPEAGFLNGMTTLPTQKDTVLIGDSDNGVVYRVNVRSGTYAIAIDSPAFKPNATAVASLGVNGIRYRKDGERSYLYFTNSFQPPTFARIPLHTDGTAAGKYETIIGRPPYPVNVEAQADDFAFDRSGNAYLTTDPSNTLVKVSLPEGSTTIVAGGVNDSSIAGDTSAAFGRTWRDQDVLYIVTNGGLAYPPSSGVVGGKVVAFNTKGL